MREDLDDVLQGEAVKEGCSTASSSRGGGAVRDSSAGHLEKDPIATLVGSMDAEPAEDIDEVIYRK